MTVRRWIAGTITLTLILTLSQGLLLGLYSDTDELDFETIYTAAESVANDRTASAQAQVEALLVMSELNAYSLNTERLLKSALALLEIGVDEAMYIPEMMGNYYLASHYYMTYNDERSLEHIYEMLDVAEANNDDFGIGLYHYFMGKLYYEYIEDEAALESLELAHQYLSTVDDSDYVTFIDFDMRTEIYLGLMAAEYRPTDQEVIDGLLDLYDRLKSSSAFVQTDMGYVIGLTLGYYGGYEDGIEVLDDIREMVLAFDYDALFSPYLDSLDVELAGYYYELGDYETAANLMFTTYVTTDIQEDVSIAEDYSNALQYLENRRLIEESDRRTRTMWWITGAACVLLLAVIVILIENRKIRALNMRIYKQSIRDGLTGLFNHTKIVEMFVSNPEKFSAIAVLDIDNFKLVNDTFGHMVGDDVLRKIAKVLDEVIQDVGHVGRYGGEEFLIIYHQIPEDDVMAITEELRHTIEAMKWDFSNEHITVSIGLMNKSGDDFKQLFRRADALLYQAKTNGKNRVCTYRD